MEHNGITNGADPESDLNSSPRLQFEGISEEPGLGEAALSSGSPVLRAGRNFTATHYQNVANSTGNY
jgi:hypothetical protein